MGLEQIGNLIKTRRKQFALTQPDLAEIAGISTNTIYQIERGQANPSFRVLDQLLDTLGLEIVVRVKNSGV